MNGGRVKVEHRLMALRALEVRNMRDRERLAIDREADRRPTRLGDGAAVGQASSGRTAPRRGFGTARILLVFVVMEIPFVVRVERHSDRTATLR